MYFIEKKQCNYYATLAHATSFNNLIDIENHGLRPLGVDLQLIEDYVKTLLPYKNEKHLTAKLLQTKSTDEAALVLNRLNQSPRTYFLPITNVLYLNGAADNALNDKGEIYKAIRLTLEKIEGVSIPTIWPQDRKVVITTKIEVFRRTSDEFEIRNPKNPSKIKTFYKNAVDREIEIDWNIPFNKLEVRNFQNFLDIPKAQANF
jgi:hypothetical protein